MSSLFCVTRERNRFLQRGEVTDVIEDGGCKTCNLGNKQQEEKFRLYPRGLAGGKRKLLQLKANLRSTDKSQNWDLFKRSPILKNSPPQDSFTER